MPGFAVDFQSHLFGFEMVEGDDPSTPLRTGVGGDAIDVAPGADDVAAANAAGGEGFVGLCGDPTGDSRFLTRPSGASHDNNCWGYLIVIVTGGVK